MEEIIVRRQDDHLYKFREGDFKRLRRQDIKDMLLLLVQGKLTNHNLDERFALNVALRMYTRRIVIQEREEDLQLAVESYQKKINILRPDSYGSDLRKITPYNRYNTTAGNPVKKNLLKLNLSDHRKLKDGGEGRSRTGYGEIPFQDNRNRETKQYDHEAKYPEYSNALVEGKDKPDLYELCVKQEPSEPSPADKKKSPRGVFRVTFGKIQARNKVLNHCGLSDEEYLVLFTSSYRDAMMLVGESYPFFKGNNYMTVINEELDYIRAFAGYKESKIISAPETWLDLRIKGSQLSQYFRRKSKHSPKGLFSYPVGVNGTNYSMHWVSEAHRNQWHVLLDATAMVMGEDRLNLALHRPDFVLCSPDSRSTYPSKITCLLVRRKSFETASSPQKF
ncbi:pyridoxal phosphate-dependent transferase, major region, subdomain 1 [Tanacetum coccineum]